jgi:hypothetical protein
MRIDGITTCVGEEYYKYLRESLHVWSWSLDSITVVTEPGDPAAYLATIDGRIRVVETDVFTRYGAKFNKGAALNYGYLAAKPSDWVLLFDADVVPTRTWREKTKDLREGCLYGARRNNDTPRTPLGYFQLFHSQDPRCGKWPLFDCRYTHAGCYDMNFAEMWTKTQQLVLNVNVHHEGPKKTNWFGPREITGSSMLRLKSKGIKAARMRDGEFSLSPESNNKLTNELRSAKV